MSRIAVIGDVHGNADALAAVLRDARAFGVTRLVVLGDLVGYYYAPARVLELLAEWPSTVVRGNHEDLLGEWLAGDDDARADLRRRYGGGLAACEQQLSAETLQWLRELPHPLLVREDGCRAALCHGHPASISAYVYPDKVETALSVEDMQGADVVWLAHTHYPMDVERAGVRVCNPGSVGQPRDRDARSSWALWEPGIRRVTWQRSSWDPTALLAMIAVRDPEVPYLRDVLTRSLQTQQ
jgi:predicted phosphodiesterase